eukprot:4857666-Alexandrium_andersonii.AAC.1
MLQGAAKGIGDDRRRVRPLVPSQAELRDAVTDNTGRGSQPSALRLAPGPWPGADQVRSGKHAAEPALPSAEPLAPRVHPPL